MTANKQTIQIHSEESGFILTQTRPGKRAIRIHLSDDDVLSLGQSAHAIGQAIASRQQWLAETGVVLLPVETAGVLPNTDTTEIQLTLGTRGGARVGYVLSPEVAVGLLEGLQGSVRTLMNAAPKVAH